MGLLPNLGSTKGTLRFEYYMASSDEVSRHTSITFRDECWYLLITALHEFSSVAYSIKPGLCLREDQAMETDPPLVPPELPLNRDIVESVCCHSVYCQKSAYNEQQAIAVEVNACYAQGGIKLWGHCQTQIDAQGGGTSSTSHIRVIAEQMSQLTNEKPMHSCRSERRVLSERSLNEAAASGGGL